MAKTFQLGTLFGIPIKIHPTFLLLPAFFGWFYAKDYGFATGLRAGVLILLVFACVLGHELCHSLKARSYGIHVPQITLYPIGGIASMMRIPEDPRQEIAISWAGPLFNFSLAIISFVPLYIILGRETLFAPSLGSWPGTFANLFWINPILGAFNLIPAFPMDGGRILRAFLTKRIGSSRATRICVGLGRIFAILFALLGLWWKHWMLILIAVFILFSGSNEKAN